MHAIPILSDVVVILGISIIVLLIASRLRVPSIVALLLVGVMAGPYGLELVDSVHEVELLAEIGVILLLFTIGIEFSFSRLLRIKKNLLISGTLQVGLSLGVGVLLALWRGFEGGTVVLIGFMVALSSTAIVLKSLQERQVMETPHGTAAVAVLIFQDLIAVPLMIAVPFLADGGAGGGTDWGVMLARTLGLILMLYVAAKWLVPAILARTVITRSRELFVLVIVFLCLSIAGLTAWAGLSFALGAFMAGLIISESRYSHSALGFILPFRDVFTSIFFVSIGMLLDLSFVAQNIVLVLVAAAIIMLLKAAIATVATAATRLPLRSAAVAGLALCQVGEFSFIIARSGLEHKLLTPETYQLFLAVAIVSMALTPLLISLAPRLAERLWGRAAPGAGTPEDTKLEDHLVIVGYGISGRLLARAAKAGNIPYVIYDLNPHTVKVEKQRGEPIHFGDLTYEPLMEAAGIARARVMAVAISDPAAVKRITFTARQLNPRLFIVTRIRYLADMEDMLELGASEVIPEEYEAGLEVFNRVLHRYMIPANEIARFTGEVRQEHYARLRNEDEAATSEMALRNVLQDQQIVSLRVEEEAFAAGKPLMEIDFRKTWGITLLAIKRDADLVTNPGGTDSLQPGDVALVYGAPKNIALADSLFSAPEENGAG